jgi:hypothetical protein
LLLCFRKQFLHHDVQHRAGGERHPVRQMNDGIRCTKDFQHEQLRPVARSDALYAAALVGLSMSSSTRSYLARTPSMISATVSARGAAR